MHDKVRLNLGDLPPGRSWVLPQDLDAHAQSRFRLPLPFLDRVIFNLRSKIAARLGRGRSFYALQVILDFLFRNELIVKPNISIEPLFADEPKFFYLRLISKLSADQTDGKLTITSCFSQAVSDNFEEAVSKTIGELLERYPLLIYRRRELLQASAAQLRGRGIAHLDPDSLAGFAEWQKKEFSKKEFDDHSQFGWVEAIELLRNQKILIPAQLVFWNYDLNAEAGEPRLREPNTNGAAGHFTLGKAALGAIYECVQRDAFLVHWLNQISPPQINPDSIRESKMRKLLDELARLGFKVFFLNTSLDFEMPSCACVIMNEGRGGPFISVAGGCSSDWESSLRRALLEAMGVYHIVRFGMESRSFSLPPSYRAFIDPVGPKERLLLWADRSMFHHFEFILRGRKQEMSGACPTSRYFNSTDRELAFVKEQFRRKGKGYEIYLYAAKHRVLDALGFYSVKAVIPALIPLYLTETNAPLGARRLEEVLQSLKMASGKGVNPYPHPFP